MEEITIELDDEVADWLQTTAAEQRKSASDLVTELIRDFRQKLAAGEREAD